VSDEDYIRRSVRRRVGLAALRRIRRLVDEDARREAANRRWARPVAMLLAVAALLAIAWIAVA